MAEPGGGLSGVARRDDALIIPNGSYLFMLAGDSGKVNVVVGPFFQQGLKQTDIPVKWDAQARKFVSYNSVNDAVQQFVFIPDGSYAVLTNPVVPNQSRGESVHSNRSDRADAFPRVGNISQPADLDYGNQLVIRGPDSFPLWPQQHAQVITGHSLQPNDFLLLRVTNEAAAKRNWPQAVVVAPASTTQSSSVGADGSANSQGAGGAVNAQETKGAQGAAQASTSTAFVKTEDLAMGKMFIIKGTDVSFFIPPTGIEVVPDVGGKYVRVAETLTSLEYCILRDVSGTEKYVRGPQTVFPLPTEEFVKGTDGSRRFRAIELNPNTGIHVKVIEDFIDDKGNKRVVGEELFITGEVQAIFWPRRELLVIKYGENNQHVHQAVPVPAGEGRYVLEKATGRVALVKGPQMLLPHPQENVFVRRALSTSLVKLLYPGNADAIAVNERLAQAISARATAEPISDREAIHALRSVGAVRSADGGFKSSLMPASAEVAGGVTRRSNATSPDTLSLDVDKYSGAVGISVHNQYAILVADSTGNQRVEVGPTRVLLEFDETVMPVTLSTGTPKTDNNPIQTAYLRIRNNRISDRIRVVTNDLCEMELHVSYRADFVGSDAEEQLKWFAVENPIQFLVDHLRSILRGMARNFSIQEFHARATDLIRDTILGVQGGDGTPRPGKKFAENNLHVTDVEVLSVQVVDEGIAKRLVQAQQVSVEAALTGLMEEQKLQNALEEERRKRKLAQAQLETTQAIAEVEISKIEAGSDVKTAEIDARLQRETADIEANQAVLAKRQEGEAAALTRKLEADKAATEISNAIAQLKLIIEAATKKQQLELSDMELTLRIKEIEANDKSLADRMKAMTPDLIAVLTSHADQALMERLVESMAPLAMVGGLSVAEVAEKFFKDTPLENVLGSLGSRIGDNSKRNGALARA